MHHSGKFVDAIKETMHHNEGPWHDEKLEAQYLQAESQKHAKHKQEEKETREKHAGITAQAAKNVKEVEQARLKKNMESQAEWNRMEEEWKKNEKKKPENPFRSFGRWLKKVFLG